MPARKRFADPARWFTACGVFITVLCAATMTASAAHRRRHHRPRHTPVVTPLPAPSATPTVSVTALVLITGGTGDITVPTGTSSAVLDAAEVYDVASGHFLPIARMTAHRDRHAATILKDGRVLIVGGVNTVLVPLIVFPGPAMPWILNSAEAFNPAGGRFTATDAMATARDDPSATLLEDGRVLVIGGGSSTAEIFDPAHNRFAASAAEMASSRYGQSATALAGGRVLVAGEATIRPKSSIPPPASSLQPAR